MCISIHICWTLSITLCSVSSPEFYCKWEPINLDHLEKSSAKKTHRSEPSKTIKDKINYKEKNSNSYQPSSVVEVPKPTSIIEIPKPVSVVEIPKPASVIEVPKTSSPKRLRLESQINVQTPATSKLTDDKVRHMVFILLIKIYILSIYLFRNHKKQ